MKTSGAGVGTNALPHPGPSRLLGCNHAGLGLLCNLTMSNADTQESEEILYFIMFLTDTNRIIA